MVNKMDAPKKKLKLIKPSVKEMVLSVASVILTAVFLPLFMYCANSAEADLVELTLPLVLFSLMAVAMLFVFFLFTKSLQKAALVSIIMMLVLENYSFIEKCIRIILPNLKYWHILPICIVLVLHLGYLLCKVLKDDIAKHIPFIATMVFGGLIAVNLVTAIPSIINKVSVENSVISEEQAEDNVVAAVDTNIYYFVLDEAASFKTLETYYDYEATEFRSFLEENNFNISENSYNESTDTHVVLTNHLNLNYVVNYSMNQKEIDTYKENPTLKQILKQQGYSYCGVGDTEWLKIPSYTTSSDTSSKTVSGESILQLTMKNTFLYPFFTLNLNEPQKVILDTFDYYKNEDAFVKNSQFLMTYLCAPHQPFIFDENGNTAPESHSMDWSDEKYYLDQYKFIMKKTMESVKIILDNDPNSIIFIISDHGPRWNSEIPPQERMSVLNCVYYKGEVLDVEGLSGVETLRNIIEKLFVIELPALEVIKND